MCIRIHVKYDLFLSYLNGTWILSTDFRKKSSNVRFHENLFPWDASSMRQTDMKPLFSFRNFANAPDKRVPHFRRRLISLLVSGDVLDSRFLPDTFQRTWSTLLHINRGKMSHCWVGVDWAGNSYFIPAVYFPLMPCGLRHLVCSVVITTNIRVYRIVSRVVCGCRKRTYRGKCGAVDP
jgi:hypothetical protein